MATSGYDAQTDRELAIGAANGDQRAFAALYDRHFHQVYDLAIRMLRDPEAAADVTQAVFGEAKDGLRAGRVPEHVRAWLYAIAMGEATGRAQQAAADTGVASIEEGRLPSLIEVDSTRRGAQAAAQDAGLRKLVWDTASRLSPREYALLDLSVRRDLSNDEVAEGLGISEETAASTVSGVRRNFEQAASVELLTHSGREACPDLDALLARPTDPAALGDAVQAHLASCDKCKETVASYPPATEVLSALALVPPTAGLKEVIWGNLAAAPAAAAPPAPPIVPPAEQDEGPNRRWWIWALLGAMALLGVIVAVAILLASGDDDEATVSNPEDIRAVGLEEGDSTTETVIEMEWDVQEGVQAYSVDWTTNRSTLPDEVGDLTGEADGVRSPELDPGSWYFHIRTQGDDGTWTDPEHVGPYNIVEPSPTPSPEPTEEPTDEPIEEPTEPPTAAPTAPPTPSPAPATSPTP